MTNGLREAKLREEYANQYPGLTPGAWLPAANVAEHIVDLVRRERGTIGIRGRVVAEDHFEFRGGDSRGDANARRERREDRPPGTATIG